MLSGNAPLLGTKCTLSPKALHKHMPCRNALSAVRPRGPMEAAKPLAAEHLPQVGSQVGGCDRGWQASRNEAVGPHQ